MSSRQGATACNHQEADQRRRVRSFTERMLVQELNQSIARRQSPCLASTEEKAARQTTAPIAEQRAKSEYMRCSVWSPDAYVPRRRSEIPTGT
ncbi:hypothetical protein PGT21_033209 [Puccinia graminis f. sp. tritici]|uniref:Uncharacterized protein n=1 Tax=Puccinia graminis f. sp. tritici TaxID=56615 RepID=A0A5B0QCZ5_PUCGR|nr:hypothetical protein PGT21_033209 [Puccinia graminis f. sp. tritici]